MTLGTAELHLSGLIGTTSLPDMQKIQIIGFFIGNRLHWQLEVQLLFFRYVPVSKPFGHARFEVLEAITLDCI